MMEIELLDYAARFRPLSWREELTALDHKGDGRIEILSAALTELYHKKKGISLLVSSSDHARQVISTLPNSVLYRAFLAYKNGIPSGVEFKTISLYRAPDPKKHMERVQEEEESDTVEEVQPRPARELSNDVITDSIMRQAGQ